MPQAARDQQALSAMWQRGLTDAAIDYVKARVRLSSDGPQHVKWLMLLMEAHAQAALRESLPTEAAAHWKKANDVLGEFAASNAAHPRLPWLQWQAGRCVLLQGQSTLAKYLAAPANQVLREETLVSVRRILAAMEQLDRDLQSMLPLAAREGFQEDKYAPVHELHRLQLDLALLECEALLVRMRIYPASSADSIAAATEIVQRTNAIATRSSEDSASSELIRVAQAIAQLEVGERELAIAELEQLTQSGTTNRVRSRAATAAIEWLAHAGDVARATRMLDLLESQAEATTPEMLLARIEIALANLMTIPAEQRQAAIAKVIQDSQTVGTQFGEYWRNRAEALVVASSSVDASGQGSPELMLAEVRQLLSSGDAKRAITRLLEFRDSEAKAGRGENAVKFASQAAALLQQEKAWDESILAVQETAIQFATTVDASSKAHRMVVWALAQKLRTNPSTEVGSDYEEAMVRQLQQWPSGTTSDEVAEWLTSWLVGKKRRRELVEVLAKRSCATNDPASTNQAALKWLEHVLLLNRDERNSAIAELNSMIIAANKNDSPAHLSISLLALSLDQWPTAAESSRQEKLLAVLRTKVGQSDPVEAASQEVVQAITSLIETLLAVRQQQSAPSSADDLQTVWLEYPWPNSVKAATMAALVEAIDELDKNQRVGWLAVINPNESWQAAFRKSPAAIEQAIAFRIDDLQAFSESALTGLKQLVEKHPADGSLRLQLAKLYAARNEIAESMRLAKFVAANTPAGSELNLAARWEVCKGLKRQGQVPAAQEAASLLIASQPLEPSVWRERFESLATQ